MVEGHGVHRVASLHRQRLVGKSFTAWSPNGRFKDGACAINGKKFNKIEAVGKNLFAFFGSQFDPVVVHVHFGMSGRWAVYENQTPPEPTSTNRLRLEAPGLVADLSAMTVQYGGMELYNSKRAKLGEDPLRDDADPEKLWVRVQTSRKSIGALIMDQSFFTGPGNIYRAEILFKAGVHPDVIGKELEKSEFDVIWFHTVALLKRGFATGSILTVDPEEARALGQPELRRYIYNSSKCPRCQTSIRTWSINNRTCYACPTCQPLKKTGAAVVTPQKECIPFNSHCAPESVAERLQASGPAQLTVKEIKNELAKLGVRVSSADKRKLVELLEEALERKPAFISSEDAAAEKATAGESLAVEHLAELAPSQARAVRVRVNKETLAFGGDRGLDPAKMTVVQLKQVLHKHNVAYPSKAVKAVLINRFRAALETKSAHSDKTISSASRRALSETRAKRKAQSNPLMQQGKKKAG
jgi:formamidopyrimidine-DNA glycosylase